MTTEQMREFALLAEKRNFIAAAKALGTTQASLSRHIMAMEDELYFSLLERNTRNVELTPLGLRFLYYAQESVRILNACRADLMKDASFNNAPMRMKYEYIREFVTAAGSEELQKAAADLNISPSVLTKHMSSLASEIGASLFLRTRKTELSRFGKIFLPYAEELTDIQDRYTEDFSGSKRTDTGEVTVSVYPLYYKAKSRELLDGFREAYPGISLNLTLCDNADISSQLLSGNCSIGLIRRDFRSKRAEGLIYYTVYCCKLAAIMMHDHPLAEADSVDFEMLRYVKLFMLPDNLHTSDIITKRCHDLGYEADLEFYDEYTSYEKIKNGEGILLYPVSISGAGAGTEFKFVPIEPEIDCCVDLVLRREALDGPAWELLRYAMENRNCES